MWRIRGNPRGYDAPGGPYEFRLAQITASCEESIRVSPDNDMRLVAARRFRVLFFLAHMSVGIQLPFFILYLKDALGMPDHSVSVLTAISGLTILVSQQAWGYAADLLISKKVLVIVNLLVSGLVFWSLGHIRSYPLLLTAFFLFQLFSTPIIQLLHGLLFAHHGSERWFGTIRAYASLSFVVANTVVGLVADRLTRGRLDFIFPAYMAVNAVSALWLALLPERRVKDAPRPNFVEVQRFFFSQPLLVWFLVTSCIYQLGHSLSYSLQAVLMVQLGAEKSVVSSSYSLAAILELPVFFAAHRLIRRFGEVRLVAFAAAVQTVRWIFVWRARTPEEIVLASSLHCVTFGMFYAAAISFMNRHAPLHLKASAQTLFALVYFGVASLVGNLLGGLLVEGGPLAHPLIALVKPFVPADLATPLRNLYLFSSLCAAVAFVCSLRLVASSTSRQDCQRGPERIDEEHHGR